MVKVAKFLEDIPQVYIGVHRGIPAEKFCQIGQNMRPIISKTNLLNHKINNPAGDINNFFDGFLVEVFGDFWSV